MLVAACGPESPEPVGPPPVVPRQPAAVTVHPAVATMEALYQTVQLTAEVRDGSGRPIEGRSVAWSSGAPSVAVVDSAGLVEARGNGAARIMAAVESVSGQAELTVEQVVSEVAVTASADTLRLGDTLQLAARAVDANGFHMEAAEFLWASSHASVVRVDGSGLATAVGAGGASVSATAGGVSDTVRLTVEEPVPSAVAVVPGAVELDAVGRTVRLTARVLDQWGEPLPGAAVERWSSGDASVATVDSAGLVTAVGRGRTVVTAAVAGASGSAEVVVAWISGGVSVTPTEAMLAPGDTLRLVASVTGDDGHPMTGAEFAWSSSNESVATVDSRGVVVAVAPGRAVVTAAVRGASRAAAEIVVVTPDRRALEALYRATGGTNWANSDYWLTDMPLQEWHGVRTTHDGSVYTLNLEHNGLRGLIPPELGDLSELAYLDLGSNALLGPIPPELGRLSNLDFLSLSNNSLVGRIPPELGGTSLEDLRLDNNRLTGPFPPALLRLDSLSRFHFRDNDGLCAPPTTAFVEWLADIPDSHESLCETDRRPLESLYDLAGGKEWINSDGWMADPALDRWHGIRVDSSGRVEAIDLAANGLSGRLTSALGQLDRLTELRIGGNALSGRLPLALAGLPLLEFDYANTELCEPADQRFQQWLAAIPSRAGSGSTCDPPTEREILAGLYHATGGPWWSDGAGFGWGTDRPLRSWAGVVVEGDHVVRLLKRGKGLAGPLPPDLGQLEQLRELDLADNDLTGIIPPDFGSLGSLEVLDLSGNDLSGPVPPDLGQLERLIILNLADNDLTGIIPPDFGSLGNLEVLNLSGNDLSGPVPPDLGRARGLVELVLRQNPGLRGPLPNALIYLRLQFLNVGGTLLCAPDNAGFRRWLQKQNLRRVPYCSNLEIRSRAYLTQAVQSLAFPVPQVAGRRALLRVFPVASEGGRASMPPVRARFFRQGVETHVIDIPAGSAPVPTQVDEGNLAMSANAEIPGDVIQPGLEMVVEIDPAQTLAPGLVTGARIPAKGLTAVDVREMPRLNLTVVPFVSSTDRSILDVTEGLTANHALFWPTRQWLPVGEMNVRVHPPVTTSDTGVRHVIGEVRAIRAMERGSGHYIGLTPAEEGALGTAEVEGWVSASLPDSAAIAHELGHNFSLLHSPCGGPAAVDSRYPDPNGAIGSWGYDFHSAAPVPPHTRDLMSYCRPYWIGDYSFTKALDFRHASADGRAGSVSPTDALLVWGGIDEESAPYLRPAFAVHAPPTLPIPGGGEYELTGRDLDGRILFSLEFDMPRMAHSAGSDFAFVVPASPQWASALSTITLAGPSAEAVLNAATDQPMAILRDRLTGTVRGFWAEPSPGELARMLSTEANIEALFSRGIPGTEQWRR